MRLSVIIVNYQVCYFLEQCLYTVLQACTNISAEIIVVDNASTDDSRERLPLQYPTVNFIWNNRNTGFGAANNQAMQIARGDFFVLLNPDTLVPQNIFSTCLDFFHEHPNAGAVGMRMYSGSGQYLPESKRGLPHPWSAFYKLTGITALFPGHSRYAHYYLGHLSPEQIHKVEVLAGAFMCFPRKLYDQLGGFDEQFFMYGEDIDLSHRIGLAGYSNYYLPAPGLIHFKGESTVKDAANRKHFFDAMILFVQKYYPSKLGIWRSLLLAAIRLRSLLNSRAEKTSVENAHNKESGLQNNSDPGSWKITGDAHCIHEITESYPQVSVQAGESACLYALGKDFGIKEVLESWSVAAIPARMRFHAIGTAAIIGSDDKSSQGEVLLLKKQPLVQPIDDNAG